MNNRFGKIVFRLVAVSLFAVLPALAFAQTARPAPPARPFLNGHRLKLAEMHGGDTTEKAIAVDKNVNIKLCVTQGNLKINGWNRSEVRVFVKDGAKFGFKILEKSKQDSPVWIMLSGFASAKGKYSAPNECIWGDEIEIDAPVASTLNITGQETKTTIDTIKKATVNIIGGDISLRNVSDGINAATHEGDVTVEESSGAMTLESTTGNIVVFGARPSQIGDIFKAKTNSGSVSLQQLEHRQIGVSSISGSVIFNGEILSGGNYNFSTSNGSIRMSIPLKSSCRVVATYGYGTFNSEIPIKIETEEISEGPVKRRVGLIGTGDATVKLTTNSGSISIKKQ